MNNDNKKSVSPWAHRLFKKVGASLAAPQSKTYFAHRYHDGHAVSGRNPFGALFSDLGKKQASWEPDTASSQRFFEDELAVVKGFPVNVESTQTCGSSILPIPGDRFDLASSTALSSQFTVLNCHEETPDTKTFRLGTAYGQVFDYLPGQYITLSIVLSGQTHKRSYSLASSPTRSKILEIAVKRDPNGGLVSNWLNDHLKIGDTLNLKGPFGKFSCVDHATKKILFLAAGSGIVPIMSMLRWLADTEAYVDAILLLSFQTRYDIIYRDELNLIAAHHKNIKLFITLTKEPLALNQWPGLTGRVNEKMIDDLVPDLPERTVYLCGPDAFMAACEKSLLQLKLPAGKLFCESFTVNSPVTSLDGSVLAKPSRSKTGSYKVSFAKSGKTIVADGRMTLLELTEKSGITIAHECRSGQCGECMIKCLEGKVEMTDQAEIDGFDRKKGWVYACCAYPASNVVLDI